MYYSTNHIPSRKDWGEYYKVEILRLKTEILQAKRFIKEAENEIQSLGELLW